MKATTEVTIAGAAGLCEDLSSVGCYVSLDGRLHDVITPLNNQPGPDTAVLLPHEGEVRFIVKNMGGDDHVFGSVSLPLTLLPDTPGQLWLPLFDRLDGDLLHTLPTEVDCPKIMLIIGTVSLLSPVQELTEGSRSSIDEELEEFNQGILSQRTSIDPLKTFDTPSRQKSSLFEHELEKSQWRLRLSTEEIQRELQQVTSQRDHERESWTSTTRRHALLVDDLKNQVTSFEKLYAQEQKRVETLSGKLATLNEKYEASQERMIERERTLMEIIDEKVLESSRYSMQVAELQELLRNLTSDKFQIEELYKQLQAQIESNTMGELQESLNLAVEQLAESEMARKKMQEEVNAASHVPDKPDSPTKPDPSIHTALLHEIESLHDKLTASEFLLEDKSQSLSSLTLELAQLRPLRDTLKANTAELKSLREALSTVTHEKASLQEEISAVTSLLRDSHTKNSELQSHIGGLQREIEKMAGMVEEAKKRPLRTGEVVDFVVGKYFAEKGGYPPMQKVGEDIYALGSKRFTLTIKNASVNVRVGSGYLVLDEFLRIYLPSDSRHSGDLMADAGAAKISPNSTRSMSVESKSHRKVNSMPDNAPGPQQSKPVEQDDELFMSVNSSHAKPLIELDGENIPEAANRLDDSYTPSPNKKVTPPLKSNKTPKTPGRRGPTSCKLTGKSIERLPRKAPFR